MKANEHGEEARHKEEQEEGDEVLLNPRTLEQARRVEASIRALKPQNPAAELEVTGGFFYNNDPAGSSLTRCAVFGEIAGKNAADFARRKA